MESRQHLPQQGVGRRKGCRGWRWGSKEQQQRGQWWLGLPPWPLPHPWPLLATPLAKASINSAQPPLLQTRLEVVRVPTEWAQSVVEQHHYLHKRVFPRADPMGYAVLLDRVAVGVIIVATIHFTKQQGLFGYSGLPTQWQVLNISRLWLHPQVQGRKTVDRRGQEHSLPLASCVPGKLLKRVQENWLTHHPLRYLDQPHEIRLIVAYADPKAGHQGTIYRAAGFQFVGWTKPAKQEEGTRGAKSGSAKKQFVRHLPTPKT